MPSNFALFLNFLSSSFTLVDLSTLIFRCCLELFGFLIEIVGNDRSVVAGGPFRGSGPWHFLSSLVFYYVTFSVVGLVGARGSILGRMPLTNRLKTFAYNDEGGTPTSLTCISKSSFESSFFWTRASLAIPPKHH